MHSSDINIPGYTINAEIGKGGMAVVYEATQESLNRKVAIKVLRNQRDDWVDERFINEAHFIASLNNPHIITIYDIAELSNGEYYIAMEYLPGGDLESNAGKYHAPSKALALVEDIAAGLAVVHEKGIIHRDIKPANILFRENGDAVLTDFGIAKSLSNDSDLTQAGFSLGSPSYSSPEQVMGKPLSVTTDLYSLGVIFLELVLGRNVFKAEGHSGTAINHIQMPLPSLPPTLDLYEPFLAKLLAKAPSDRYQNCGELLEAIESLKTESEVSPKRASASKVSQRKGGGAFLAKLPAKRNLTPRLLKNASLPKLSALAIIVAITAFTFLYESETDKKIKALLAQAEKRMHSEHYIHPKNDNARYFYRQILLLDEDNRRALRGIKKVNKAQIDRYIAAGAKAIEEQRLSSPKSENAIYYFRQILVIDKENKSAYSGLQQIAGEYLKRAKFELMNSDYKAALNDANQGLKAVPEHKELLALREEIKEKSPSARKRLKGVISKIRDKLK